MSLASFETLVGYLDYLRSILSSLKSLLNLGVGVDPPPHLEVLPIYTFFVKKGFFGNLDNIVCVLHEATDISLNQGFFLKRNFWALFNVDLSQS